METQWRVFGLSKKSLRLLWGKIIDAWWERRKMVSESRLSNWAAA